MREPAFPSQPLNANGDPSREAWEGMSLRDYFAAKAMAAALCGLIARGDGPTSDGELEVLSRRSYQTADAMLKERAK